MNCSKLRKFYLVCDCEIEAGNEFIYVLKFQIIKQKIQQQRRRIKALRVSLYPVLCQVRFAPAMN